MGGNRPKPYIELGTIIGPEEDNITNMTSMSEARIKLSCNDAGGGGAKSAKNLPT